jgi:hypothetical protein
MKIEDECGKLKRNMSPIFPDSCITDLPDRSALGTRSRDLTGSTSVRVQPRAASNPQVVSANKEPKERKGTRQRREVL